MQSTVNPDEHVLSDFLGVFAIAKKTIRNGVGTTGMPPHQGVKGTFVATLETLN